MNGHKEDILSIAVSPPNLLATSSYDGEVSSNAGTELRSFIADKGTCARSGTLTTTLLPRPRPNVEIFMRRTKL